MWSTMSLSSSITSVTSSTTGGGGGGGDGNYYNEEEEGDGDDLGTIGSRSSSNKASRDRRRRRSTGSAAEVLHLTPQTHTRVLTDCCYFILHMGATPPPSTNPFEDDDDDDDNDDLSEPPRGTNIKKSSRQCQNNSSSIRSRKKRIYGMCRRAPAAFPYCVLLLSAVPCFGILRHQFMSLTSSFFNKACQDDDGDLQAFLLSAANPTTGILHREVMTQTLDIPVMWLVNLLGIEHILGLVKLLLLEGRMLFYSSKPSKASGAVLALLTLLPGVYNQVMQAHSLFDRWSTCTIICNTYLYL